MFFFFPPAVMKRDFFSCESIKKIIYLAWKSKIKTKAFFQNLFNTTFVIYSLCTQFTDY